MGTARFKKILVAVALVPAFLLAPAPAAARVTVSVQIAYGGAVVGGVGFFVYLAGYWELSLAERGLPTALLELRGERLRFGVPLPVPDPAPAAAGEPPAAGGVRLDLLRWRF